MEKYTRDSRAFKPTVIKIGDTSLEGENARLRKANVQLLKQNLNLSGDYYLSQQILRENTQHLNFEIERLLFSQKKEEQKNKDVLDSIRYANRIQQTLFPDAALIKELIPESFVLFKPKDIVSGDLFWLSKKESKVIFASIDCTGHGVPGAFMSIIAYILLNKIVNEQDIQTPATILNTLHKEVRIALKQYDEDSGLRDGMDIALCSVDFSNKELQFAGANRPMYLIENGLLEEIKGDKFGIGGHVILGKERFYSNHTFEIKEDMMLYLTTDGFADQFGGIKNKKFMTNKLKDLFQSIYKEKISIQEQILDTVFEHWKGQEEQTDDVLVVAFRLSGLFNELSFDNN